MSAPAKDPMTELADAMNLAVQQLVAALLPAVRQWTAALAHTAVVMREYETARQQPLLSLDKE